MPWWRASVVVLAACSSHYGTYLIVDGSSSKLAFDRVELYFGAPVEVQGFATPAHPGFNPGPVFSRAFVATDIVQQPTGASATYYVPPGGDNDALGAYVLAIAYQGQTPVGIGERFGFEIAAGKQVYEYPIALEPYVAAAVERWGPTPDCIAWQHHRAADPANATSLVAVVRADDRDCDGFETAVDCDDLAFCAADDPACNVRSVCGTSTTCAIGCVATTGTCKSQLCVTPGLCAPMCALKGSDIKARYDCGIVQSLDHTEIKLATHSGVPCETQFAVVPFGNPCKDARLEYADSRITDGYTFQVGDDGLQCLVTLIAPSTNAPFVGDDHIVISFDAPTGGGLRWSFVLGLTGGSVTSCPPPPTYSVTPAGTVDDCL
jgi:hypothetical protein